VARGKEEARRAGGREDLGHEAVEETVRRDVMLHEGRDRAGVRATYRCQPL
jgi:hypothetical protein